jgi:hypothetical protein
MQGVRAYTARIREFLTLLEYEELCRSMGVPADMPKQSPQEQPPPPPQQSVNTAQQMQMMQMLSQLMMGQGNANNASPVSPLMGGGPGAQAGGLNPALLLQLLSQTQNGGNNAGGLNPLLLAQLLGSMGGMK